MTQTTHPTKEQVREYMAAPARKESPPPANEEIRRQLGWRLVPSNGPAPEVPD
jgi:hypothetical protein